jgi:hypothetical protein
VNVCFHESAERFINQAMPLQSIELIESRGYDADLEVPPAVTCTDVTRMLVAIVDDLEHLRSKCSL